MNRDLAIELWIDGRVDSAHPALPELTPPESPVPPAVRSAILRGLARRPEDRFPSMVALLGALAVDVPSSRRRMLWAALGALLVAIVVCLAWVWTREPATSPPAPSVEEPQTADEAYAVGEAAYNRGDFATAIKAFKRGFTLEPDLSKKSLRYLFDLGQAYRQSGNCREASFAFKRYLALKVDIKPALRADLERRIADLEDCAKQQAASEQ